MRNLLLAVCLFFAGAVLNGQEEVVVLQSSGKVQFLPAGNGKAQSVYPGTRLSINGKIKLPSGALAKLLYNGATYPLKGGRTYLLSEVLNQNGAGSGMSFTGRFWNFLSGSMKDTQNEKQLVENHRRYMEAVRAGVKGFAEKDYPIRSGRHLEGKMSGGTVRFAWTGPKETRAFLFKIRSNPEEQEILSAWVRDSVFEVDPSQLALEPGGNYTWIVLTGADNEKAPRSAAHEFVFDPGAAEVMMTKLADNPEYRQAAPLEQQLMKAFMLEESEFFYEADRVYADAAKAFPGNALVRDTRAAFLSRTDRLDEAKTILQQK